MQCSLGLFTTLEDINDPSRKKNEDRKLVMICSSYRCSGHNNKGVIKDLSINKATCPDCGHHLLARKIREQDRSTFYYKRSSYEIKKQFV